MESYKDREYYDIEVEIEKQDNILSNIRLCEIRMQRYVESLKSELAKIDAPYRKIQQHSLEIQINCHERWVERFNKQLEQTKEYANKRFIQRIHEIQANYNKGASSTNEDNKDSQEGI